MPGQTSKQRPLGATVAKLRSGTAARLAGLPVTTLHVWERRYAVANAERSPTGRRLYSQEDVARLRLLRQLTQAGHAIGAIAGLDLASLQALEGGLSMPAVLAPAAKIHVVVVGRSAAPALEAVSDCVVVAVHDDLTMAARALPPETRVDVLIVRLPSLQPASVEHVLHLGSSVGAAAIVVVYAFGTEASALALRHAGVRVGREPLSSQDLAHLLRPETTTTSTQEPAATSPSWRTARRRFSDEALALLSQAPSQVSCECMRHMAEICQKLAAFERYSQECASGSAADAELHRQLSQTSGAARAMFEEALTVVVDQRGVAVDLGLRAEIE